MMHKEEQFGRFALAFMSLAAVVFAGAFSWILWITSAESGYYIKSTEVCIGSHVYYRVYNDSVVIRLDDSGKPVGCLEGSNE